MLALVNQSEHFFAILFEFHGARSYALQSLEFHGHVRRVISDLRSRGGGGGDGTLIGRDWKAEFELATNGVVLAASGALVSGAGLAHLDFVRALLILIIILHFLLSPYLIIIIIIPSYATSSSLPSPQLRPPPPSSSTTTPFPMLYSHLNPRSPLLEFH